MQRMWKMIKRRGENNLMMDLNGFEWMDWIVINGGCLFRILVDEL